MLGRAAILGLLLSGAFVGPLAAATLTGVQGNVLVHRSGQVPAFIQAAGDIELRPGDMVVANNGTARLVYDAGCAVGISANSSLEVLAVAPCAPTATGQVAGGGGAGTGGGNGSGTGGGTGGGGGAGGIVGPLVGLGLAAGVALGPSIAFPSQPDSR